MCREQLAEKFAGDILATVKDNGWKRSISEDIGINRREFKTGKIANMKLCRVLRILVALAFRMNAAEWWRCWMRLGTFIYDMADNSYAEFCDERRTKR